MKPLPVGRRWRRGVVRRRWCFRRSRRRLGRRDRAGGGRRIEEALGLRQIRQQFHVARRDPGVAESALQTDPRIGLRRWPGRSCARAWIEAKTAARNTAQHDTTDLTVHNYLAAKHLRSSACICGPIICVHLRLVVLPRSLAVRPLIVAASARRRSASRPVAAPASCSS